MISLGTLAYAVRRCEACGVMYATSPMCGDCLRVADADAVAKRIVLLPHEFAD